MTTEQDWIDRASADAGERARALSERCRALRIALSEVSVAQPRPAWRQRLWQTAALFRRRRLGSA